MSYKTREEAKQAVFEYIEIYYNRKRTQRWVIRAFLSTKNKKFSLNN
jgi:hypothetical protein